MGVEDILRDFGLTDTEIKIYLALLKLGEATAPDIAAKTKVYKSNAYDALGKLEQKGLASHVKKENKMFFSSMDPQRLFEIIEDKKQDLESVFPMLEQFYKAKKTEREIHVLSGLEGMKTFFNDVYNAEKENIYSIGSSLQMHSVMKHRYIQLLGKLKKEKVSMRLVVVDRKDIRKQVNEFYKNFENIEYRFYPEKYLSPAAFATYGNRLAMTIWEDEPLTILIKDKSISKAFRNYFEMMWIISKK